MLDKAFDALKTYDWGPGREVLKPIDEAIVASQGDAAARAKLEKRLLAVLGTDVSYDAKDSVLRWLRSIGTAASVPTLAALLTDEKYAHMARYALVRNPSEQAVEALRAALSKVSDEVKVGVIASLATRNDVASVGAIAPLLNSQNATIARSAALGLGSIGGSAAAKALAGVKTADAATKIAAIDASLACAEGLLSDGNKAEAKAVYMRLISDKPAKHVKLAATRGILACAK